MNDKNPYNNYLYKDLSHHTKEINENKSIVGDLYDNLNYQRDFYQLPSNNYYEDRHINLNDMNMCKLNNKQCVELPYQENNL